MRLRSLVALFLVIVALIAAAAILTRPGRLLLAASQSSVDVLFAPRLQPGALLGQHVREESFSIQSDGRNVQALLLRPNDHQTHSALILSLGVAGWLTDNRRTLSWARSFTSQGVIVVAIDSPELRNDEIQRSAVDDLIAGFTYLRSLPSVRANSIGFLGISVGGSLALIAAADPSIAEEVASVDTIGAYYSVREMLKAVTAGDGSGWQATNDARQILAKQVIDTTTSGSDKAILLDIYYHADQAARSEVGQLSPQGQAVLEFLDNRSPQRFDGLLAALGPGVNALDDLSPDRVLDQLHTKLTLLHSKRDDYVPYSQAVELKNATSKRLGTKLITFSSIEHADPRDALHGPSLATDMAKMYLYVFRLLERLT